MKLVYCIVALVLTSLAGIANAEYPYPNGYTGSRQTFNGRSQHKQVDRLEVVNDRRVFFNDSFFFGQAGYFDVGDNLRLKKLESAYFSEQRQRQSLEEKVRLLEETIERLEAKLDSGNPSGGGLVEPKNDQRLPFKLPKGSELDVQVSSLFQDNDCASCHTEGKTVKKNFVVFTKDEQLASFTQAQLDKLEKVLVGSSAELKSAGLKRMPLGGELDDKDKQLVRDWLKDKR